MVGGTNQIGYNLGKSVHVLLSQIQEYVFEFNLSHQSQKTESENEVTFRNVSHKTFSDILTFPEITKFHIEIKNYITDQK